MRTAALRHKFLPPAPRRDVVTTGVSPRRAYAEVLGLYGLVFGPSVVNAALLLVLASPHEPKVPTPLYGWAVSAQLIPPLGLAVWLVIVLSRRRGIALRDLGIRAPWASRGPYRVQAWVVFVLGGAALIAATVVAALISRVTGQHGYPMGGSGGWALWPAIAVSLDAGVLEELLLCGFLVTTLEQARQPRWRILAVGVVLRWAFHLYYGVASIHVFVWAGAFLALYIYTRRLMPLILLHAAWDFVVFSVNTLGKAGFVVYGIAILCAAGVPIAVATWAFARSVTRQQGRFAGSG